MSGAEDVKLSVKVVLNKQKNKVLFAEANSDFVDVLISFLTLPLGAAVRVLKKHYGDKEAPVFGSITSLYNGLANLDSVYFWTEGFKEMLLNPRSLFYAEFLKLKLDISDTQPTEYFTCENWYKYCPGMNLELSCLSMYYDTAKCFCENEMTRKLGITKMCRDANGDCEVFTRNTAPFIISDDLQIFSNSTNFIRILANLGITDMDFGDPKIVTFGFSEMMDLLKGSLLSRTPLTDVLLNNKREVDDFARLKFEPGNLASKENGSTFNTKKMILKVTVQKSTNKILFARAEEDFVDFLCVLLAIPLGAVECLLDNRTCLKAIDNLYRSIDNMDKHLVTPEMKNRLMKGNLPHGYISKKQNIPLTEESFNHTYTIGSRRKRIVQFSSVKFVKGQGKYIMGPTMYKVTDDLTVTPSCMASIVSDLKEQNIPLSNIQELELEIGSKEALSILRASLTSTSALSDGLKINTTMLPKQEQ